MTGDGNGKTEGAERLREIMETSGIRFRPGDYLDDGAVHEHRVTIMGCYSGNGGDEWIYRSFCPECRWTRKLRTEGNSPVQVLDIPNPVV